MGGDDSPENLTRVTIQEHAELHFALYLEHGLWGDYIAAMTLSGQTGFSMAGFRHTDESRAKMGYDWSDEQREAKSQLMTGKKRGRYNNGLTDEERKAKNRKRHTEYMRRWRLDRLS